MTGSLPRRKSRYVVVDLHCRYAQRLHGIRMQALVKRDKELISTRTKCIYTSKHTQLEVLSRS